MAYRIDTWRDVVIGVWRATPTASCLGDMDAALSAVVRQWPSVALLNIAEHTVEMPSSELRRGCSLLSGVERVSSGARPLLSRVAGSNRPPSARLL